MGGSRQFSNRPTPLRHGLPNLARPMPQIGPAQAGVKLILRLGYHSPDDAKQPRVRNRELLKRDQLEAASFHIFPKLDLPAYRVVKLPAVSDKRIIDNGLNFAS